MQDDRPLVALTMGDVAGVGPEVIALAWAESPLRDLARPLVIGCPVILHRAIEQVGGGLSIQLIRSPEEAEPSADLIPCLPSTSQDLSTIKPGKIDARAGQAAFEFLNKAIDLALEGKVDAITTLPINKESLHAAGVRHPGHTEILAERCQAPSHAMMLYLPPPFGSKGAGLGVVHATLHVALRQVFDLLTLESVGEAIALADQGLRPLTDGRRPHVAVAGLNPHAGEHGLFGSEESEIIEPAIQRAQSQGIDVLGPFAADTLFFKAIQERAFDAVVAMYHDQGHVALKTIGFERAVNVTLGLPIVRTSVAHGTAFDIAWKGKASTASLIEAVRVAGRIVSGRNAQG